MSTVTLLARMTLETRKTRKTRVARIGVMSTLEVACREQEDAVATMQQSTTGNRTGRGSYCPPPGRGSASLLPVVEAEHGPVTTADEERP
jgi:hypothetical protein